MNIFPDIDRSFIDTALANKSADFGNDVLYKLCSEYSSHKTEQVVIAKVLLIGRAYAAAIERRKNKTSDLSSELFYEKEVAPEIIASPIDEWLGSLDENTNEHDIIKVHHKLMSCFEQISGHKNRSLASKYLHFHKPDLFYIFDSRAAIAISKVTPKAKLKVERPISGRFDKPYAQFFLRCHSLKENLEKRFGFKLSPRELDKILLQIAESYRIKG